MFVNSTSLVLHKKVSRGKNKDMDHVHPMLHLYIPYAAKQAADFSLLVHL